MILKQGRMFEQRTGRPWGVTAAVGAIVLMLAVCGAWRGVGATPLDKPAAAAKTKATGDPLRYSARVIEKGTGTPVADATVTVARFIWPDPTTGGRRVLQETKHQTDAEGKYDFAIIPEHLAEPQLALLFRVEHPSYPTEDDYHYGCGNLRRYEAHEGRTSFETEVSLAQPITGVVETPDGKPAAGVTVSSFSYSSRGAASAGNLLLGSPAETRTDGQGRFRLLVVTPGEVDLRLVPEAYAVSVHQVKENRRGNIGRFVLRNGITLTGKVLDADRKPLAGVMVNAAGFPKQPKKDELLGDSSWDGIGSFSRSTTTDANGDFTMAPLPPGFYRVIPVETNLFPPEGGIFRRLPAPFTSLKVTLKDGETPRPLEIRALPQIVVEAQLHDSKGRPWKGPNLIAIVSSKRNDERRGGLLALLPQLIGDNNEIGNDDGSRSTCSGWPDPNGKIRFHAPRGMHAAIFLNDWSDEYHAMRQRIGKNGSLNNDDRLELELADRDVKDIEIICYESPTVLVRVVAKNGSKPKGTRVKAVYRASRGLKDGEVALENDQRRVDEFREQDDGRFRSVRLLPDQPLTLTVSADGYRPRSEMLQLPEGVTKELELVLDPK